jgi:SAM-dependent methyltransferase
MNESVINFYNKENNPEYWKKYNREHGLRIDFTYDYFNFKDVKNEKLVDFGGGFGYFLNKFDKSNSKIILDGADINVYPEGIGYFKVDLNMDIDFIDNNTFDKSFCFETLEHISNLYQCVCFIKRVTKIGGEIYISIPNERTTHNTIYPGLFYPETNFEEFLGQMALPIEDKVYSDHSFPSWIYKCQNRPWNEKKMKWTKSDTKYIEVPPLDMINL